MLVLIKNLIIQLLLLEQSKQYGVVHVFTLRNRSDDSSFNIFIATSIFLSFVIFHILLYTIVIPLKPLFFLPIGKN